MDTVTWFNDVKKDNKPIRIYQNSLLFPKDIFEHFRGKKIAFGIDKDKDLLVIAEDTEKKGKTFEIGPKTLKVNSVALITFITENGYEIGEVNYKIEKCIVYAELKKKKN